MKSLRLCFLLISYALSVSLWGTASYAQVENDTVFTVINTGDSGAGSYRDAVRQANRAPGATIAFRIPATDPNFVDGVFVITLKSRLPAITASDTTIDGATQIRATGNTNYGSPVICFTGDIRNAAGDEISSACVTIIDAANCRINALTISGGFSFGVVISGPTATGNRVTGCFIGTDVGGQAVVPVGRGVRIARGAHKNIIGGELPADRNVIGGTSFGVEIHGAGTIENVVAGNYLGVVKTGAVLLIDTKIVAQGIPVSIIAGASKNIIGGVTPGARNVIAGKNYDVMFADKGTSGNIVQGNYIGCDKTGRVVLGTSKAGVFITGEAEKSLIGGEVAGAGNLIAGRATAAIYATFSNGNIIQGNTIGLDATGKAPLGQSAYLVFLYESSQNQIGGATLAARNVIAGSAKAGVMITSGDSRPEPPHHNVVQGNSIGLDTAGQKAVGALATGIAFRGNNNVIGIGLDPKGAGNVIAVQNSDEGVTPKGISTTNAATNTIRGNTVFSMGGVGLSIDTGGASGATVTAATQQAGKLVVTGSLRGTPNAPFYIDFYGCSAIDPASKALQEHYLGGVRVTTDATGQCLFNFAGPVPLGIAEVKTTTTNADKGGTSGFSKPHPIAAG